MYKTICDNNKLLLLEIQTNLKLRLSLPLKCSYIDSKPGIYLHYDELQRRNVHNKILEWNGSPGYFTSLNQLFRNSFYGKVQRSEFSSSSVFPNLNLIKLITYTLPLKLRSCMLCIKSFSEIPKLTVSLEP